MEINPLYSDWLTVVDQDEFNLLSKLSDDWERQSDSCLRRVEGDTVYIVMTQQEWDRHEEIRKRIEMECAALDASIPTDQASTEMERLLAVDVTPKVVAGPEETAKPAKPKQTTGETEQELHHRLFIAPPNHPASSNRRPSWYRSLIDPFGEN